MREENSINDLLLKLSIAVRIANENLMCDVGLHSGQAQILMALWDRDTQSQAELVQKLTVSPPTVNKMVKKLVESGFVTTERCPEDKRLVRVRLTAKGAAIQPKVENQLVKLEKMVLEDFSDTERVLIPILLAKINKNLEVSSSAG